MSWFINDVDEPSDIAILNIKGFDYRCNISLISKNEAIKLLQNDDLSEKSWAFWKNNLFSYIKMGKEVSTFGNIEIEKVNFIKIRLLFLGGNVDTEKVLVSNKFYFG